MKRVTWIVVALGVAALSAVAVVRGGASSRPRLPATSTQPVRFVRRDLDPFVKATGVIRPRVGAEVRVGSRISGVVTRLFVQIGDTVTKGQLLATLDDRDLVSRRDEATAALHRAEIDLRYSALDLERKRALAATDKLAMSELEVAER